MAARLPLALARTSLASTFEVHPYQLHGKNHRGGVVYIFESLVVFGTFDSMSSCMGKRGLPHPNQCPLCDQEDETVQHILTSCIFSRQFWFQILQSLNLGSLVPNRRSTSFAVWWMRSWWRVPKQHRKGFNTLVILGAWILWKHRSSCIFNGSAPNLQGALHAFHSVAFLWQFAGAKGLAALGLGRVG